MISFNFQKETRILIYRFRNYRKEYYYDEYFDREESKWFDSYAIFNGETGFLKIVNVDNLKTSTYDYMRMAYVLQKGEKALVMKNGNCYYMNERGDILDHIEKGEFRDYRVNHIGQPLSFLCEEYDDNENDFVDNDDFLQNSLSFDINPESNEIIHEDGRIIQTDFKLLEKTHNVIICYKEKQLSSESTKRLFGLCDANGVLLCKLSYDNLLPNKTIHNKYITVEKDKKYGLIDFDGNEILSPIYEDYIDDCDGNVAIVNEHHELIDVKSLSSLFTTEYHILSIVNGWMRVVSDTLYYKFIGLLDSQGNLHEFFELPFSPFNRMTAEKYRSLDDAPKIKVHLTGSSFNDGLLPFRSTKRGFGYFNIEGKEVIECKYCEVSDFHNGKAKVRFQNKYGYINTDGCVIVNLNGNDIVLPKKYDWASDYNNQGFSIVQIGDKFGAIDKFQHEIIPCSIESEEQVFKIVSKTALLAQNYSDEEYKDLFYSYETPIRFEENKRYGYKRKDGKIICPPVLIAGDFHEGLATISIEGQRGYINENLDVVIEPKYKYADDFSEGLALVYDGDYSYINKCGDEIIDCGRDYEGLGPFKGGTVRCERNYHLSRHDNEYCELTKYTIGFEITYH